MFNNVTRKNSVRYSVLFRVYLELNYSVKGVTETIESSSLLIQNLVANLRVGI